MGIRMGVKMGGGGGSCLEVEREMNGMVNGPARSLEVF